MDLHIILLVIFMCSSVVVLLPQVLFQRLVSQIPPRASASDLFVLNRKPLKSTGHLVSLAPQSESVSSLEDWWSLSKGGEEQIVYGRACHRLFPH